LTVVDGTSAAGGVFFDVKETDVYYFSLQKNLGSEGGLWIAFLSPKAIDRSSEIVQYRPGSKYYRWIPDFLSLSKAIENSYKNQTLNTPSISTLILLNEQLKYIEKKGGIQWADQHTKELSDYLYSWADRNFLLSAFVEPQYRSQTVVTIDIDPRINVEDLLELASQKGVKDIFAYRSLKRNQIRIACFTSIDFDDLKKLTNILDQALKQLSE
jgi:phosphoserine aminotransferase